MWAGEKREWGQKEGGGGREVGYIDKNYMCPLNAGTLLIQRLNHQTLDGRGRSTQLYVSRMWPRGA